MMTGSNSGKPWKNVKLGWVFTQPLPSSNECWVWVVLVPPHSRRQVNISGSSTFNNNRSHKDIFSQKKFYKMCDTKKNIDLKLKYTPYYIIIYFLINEKLVFLRSSIGCATELVGSIHQTGGFNGLPLATLLLISSIMVSV